MKKNKFILGFAIILGLLFSLSRPLSSPSITSANPPADVFTGQFIPAFIGAEYDPTLAFQELAGSTVYVWAYDNWNASNPTNFIVENLAIKTQVRADGTFQAMGLPHASYYAVYFPDPETFSPNLSCDRVASCVYEQDPTMIRCGPDTLSDTCINYGEPSYPNPNNPAELCCVPWTNNDIQNTNFRPPTNNDDIADIFSYAQVETPNEVHLETINTQVPTETVNLRNRSVFVTSSNRLDIDSHTNIFPLVPKSVIKLQIDTNTFGDTNDSNNAYMDTTHIGEPVDVIITRIGAYREDFDTLGTQYILKDSPTVTGKTDKSGYFKAYMPSGYYKIEYAMGTDYSINGLAFKEVNNGPSTIVDTIDGGPPLEEDIERIRLQSLWPDLTSNEDTQPDIWNLYRNGLHIWGQLTRNLKDFETPNAIEMVIPIITQTEVVNGDIYIKPPTKNETGLVAEDDIINFDVVNLANNSFTAGDVNFSTTNKMGIFYFRAANIYNAISTDISLIRDNTNMSLGPIRFDGTNFDRITQSTLPIENGIYFYPFSLVPVKTIGSNLKALDSNGVYLSGATVSITPKDANSNNKSYAKNNFNGKTDEFGEVYISPYEFTEDPNFNPPANCSNAGDLEASGLEDYVVLASKGDLKSSITLTASDICNSFTTLLDYSTDYAMRPPTSDISQTQPGLIRFAQNIGSSFQVMADTESDTALNCYIYDKELVNRYDFDGDNFGIYSFPDDETFGDNIPIAAIPISFNGSISENKVVGLITGPKDVLFIGKDIAYFNRSGSFNAIDTTLLTEPGLLYSTSTGEAKLFIPCLPGRYEIKIETGENLSTFMTGKTSVYGVNPYVPATYETKILDMNENKESRWMDNKSLTVNGKESYQSLEVTSTGDDYEVSPSTLSFALQATCPSVKITDSAVETFMASVTCSIGKAVGKLIETATTLLEKSILHTPSVSNIGPVVILWNLMRTIANGVAIILVIIFIFRYMLRLDTKDLPLKELPVRLIKGVILANISLLYCQLFIDIANISVRAVFSTIDRSIASQLASGATGMQSVAVGGVSTFGVAIVGILSNLIGAGIGMAGGATYVATTTGVSLGALGTLGPFILGVVLAIVSTLLSLFMIIIIQFFVRLAVVYVCVIIAPIRFMIAITPSGEGFVKLWDGIFYSFVFMQTIAALLIGLGTTLFAYLPEGQDFMLSISQLLVGIGITYISIKSPNVALGLLGGGGMAGKLVGGASGSLDEMVGEKKNKLRSGSVLSERLIRKENIAQNQKQRLEEENAKRDASGQEKLTSFKDLNFLQRQKALFVPRLQNLGVGKKQRETKEQLQQVAYQESQKALTPSYLARMNEQKRQQEESDAVTKGIEREEKEVAEITKNLKRGETYTGPKTDRQVLQENLPTLSNNTSSQELASTLARVTQAYAGLTDQVMKVDKTEKVDFLGGTTYENLIKNYNTTAQSDPALQEIKLDPASSTVEVKGQTAIDLARFARRSYKTRHTQRINTRDRKADISADGDTAMRLFGSSKTHGRENRDTVQPLITGRINQGQGLSQTEKDELDRRRAQDMGKTTI